MKFGATLLVLPSFNWISDVREGRHNVIWGQNENWTMSRDFVFLLASYNRSQFHSAEIPAAPFIRHTVTSPCNWEREREILTSAAWSVAPLYCMWVFDASIHLASRSISETTPLWGKSSLAYNFGLISVRVLTRPIISFRLCFWRLQFGTVSYRVCFK